jgi:RND family efflux transporter MFP subunit
MNQLSMPPIPDKETRHSHVHEAKGDEAKGDEAKEDPALDRSRGRAARWLGIGAMLVLALMVGIGVWFHMARRAAAQDALHARQNAVPLIRAETVKADDKPRVIDLPGTMQAFDAATLYARATGYIAQRNVDIGSHVHRGDVLAVIAAPDLDEQLAQARAQLLQMEAALQQAQSSRALAQNNNQRTSRLVVEGWNSKQQGDTDRTTFQTQTAGVRVAQANLAAQVAQVNRLVELTGFERVLAPFDGVITSRAVDVGTLVTADQSSGTSLFGIARTDVLRVQVYVPQENFFGLKDGEQAEITVPQLPGRVFHGSVARNAAALNTTTRTLLAEVDVDNKDQTLSAGLYGIVHFKETRPKPVIIVPSEAIIFNQDGLSAAVFENGQANLRHLTVLNDNGATLEISDGLKPGDKIILNPPANLVAGMKVRGS